MSSFVKKLEVAANAAIVVTALLLCVILMKHQPAGGPRSEVSVPVLTEQSPAGGKVNLPGVDWQKNKRTLLLALSTNCHFCTESCTFYQRLAKEAKTIHLAAVFPQTVEDGRQYLDEHAIRVEGVHQINLDSLGVEGTPTLVLVDDKGVVINSWVGRLPAEEEAEVLSAVE
jgi:hypothetical protein